jgi:hypothetical protein
VTDDQLLLMFFGVPLAVLGIGLRRALGNLALLAVILVSGALAAYAILLEWSLRLIGYGLPLPGVRAQGLVRGFGPFCIGATLLGALAGVLLRYQGRGSTSSWPRDGGGPEGEESGGKEHRPGSRDEGGGEEAGRSGDRNLTGGEGRG